MLIIEIRRPHDALWYGWYTHKLFILDTEHGWAKELPIRAQTDIEPLTRGAETAAQLFGRTLDWYLIKEG